MALPAWLACTVQVPVLTKMIVAPFVPPEVQTKGVVVLKLTARPDDAVALTVTGDCASVLLVSATKVTVWLAFDTLKLRLTNGAAL